MNKKALFRVSWKLEAEAFTPKIKISLQICPKFSARLFILKHLIN